MPRLAHLLRPLARASALAAGLGLALAPRAAAASEPLSTYSVPQLVELLPTADTAARVVIHGVFFQLTTSLSFSYSTPKCGVMYFECQAGHHERQTSARHFEHQTMTGRQFFPQRSHPGAIDQCTYRSARSRKPVRQAETEIDPVSFRDLFTMKAINQIAY